MCLLKEKLSTLDHPKQSYMWIVCGGYFNLNAFLLALGDCSWLQPAEWNDYLVVMIIYYKTPQKRICKIGTMGLHEYENNKHVSKLIKL